MTELKPCPFCGSLNIGDTGLWRHVIKCHNCGAASAPHSKWDLAVDAWNIRYEKLTPAQKHAHELFDALCHVLLQLQLAANGFGNARIDAVRLDNLINTIAADDEYAVPQQP